MKGGRGRGGKGAYIHTVATAETIHYVHLDAEAHVWKLFSDSLEHLDAGFLLFFLGEDERTNRSVRTNVGTLVALYAVVSFPYRNESCHTAFFGSGRS